MNLKLRTHKVAGATVVEVTGEVELHNASQLRDELLQASETEHPCLVADLSRVTFIDSTGVGVLVGVFKRVREKGTLLLVCPQRNIRRVFEITGLTQVFTLHQSLDEALNSCDTGTKKATRSSDLAPTAVTTVQPLHATEGGHHV